VAAYPIYLDIEPENLKDDGMASLRVTLIIKDEKTHTITSIWLMAMCLQKWEVSTRKN